MHYLADDCAIPEVTIGKREYDLFCARRRPDVTTRARFMWRCLSRITLEITDVRGERLNAIDKTDAIAEGIERIQVGPHEAWKNYRFKTEHPRRGVTITDQEHRVLGYESPIASYQSLWESINGAGSWALNPWVWVVSFQRVPA